MQAEKEIIKQKSRASEAETAKEAAEAKLATAQGELVHVRAAGSRTPFAVVLIDGDGYIFDERLIQQGTSGGEKAGHHILRNIHHHFQSQQALGGSHAKFDDAINWRVVVKIYINIEGLAKTLYKGGRIANYGLMRDFAIGLTQSHPLIDVVDVGKGCVSGLLWLIVHTVNSWLPLCRLSHHFLIVSRLPG